MARVAFLGLGVMGGPIAGHLADAGHEVTVYNRTRARAAAWCAEHGGAEEPTPRDAARDCEVVFCCVGADPDLRDVLLGPEGALVGMAEGALLVDHTTASAAIARELATAAGERGVSFLDAPVSGGEQGARSGALTVMVGGEPAAFARAEPFFAHYAKRARLMGPSGSGQLTKMVNQICIAGLLQGLSEGLHFARSSGLDVASVVDVISQGAAQSWQMDNRWETMVDGHYEHGFAVEWMRKDLDLALAEARRRGASLPVTALVDQFYSEVQSAGGNRWDTSSLFERLERLRRKG